MSRSLARAAVALLLLAPLPSSAEEPPHLELVKGLRERHYPDLALEYLKKLAQRTDLPSELAARLPLEMARTQLDIASATSDVNQRLSLYLEARKQFDDFLAKNPQSPLAGPARLEIAHVAVLQGKTQLARALRARGPAAAAEAAKARQLLEDADKQLETVVPLLKAQVDNYPNPTTAAQKAEKKELEDAYHQAELDRGLNLFDIGRTYVEQANDEVLKARAKAFDQAADALKKVADGDEKSTHYWLAQAWIGRCLQETGDPKAARRKYADVISAAGKETEAGKRVARYFRIRIIEEAPDPEEAKKKAQDIHDATIRWLKDYQAYVHSPEGYGVRFYLARADVELALEMKTPAVAKANFFNEAKGYLKELEQTDNEFQDDARRLKLQIIEAQGGLKVDVARLTTFDDCYVRAQYEDSLLEKKDLKEEERTRHLKTEIAALTRALDLVQNNKQKAPEEDVNNARVALVYAYWSNGDLREAIKAGEELARVPARPPQSGRAAVYVLHAYSQLLDDPQGNNLSDDQVDDLKARFRQFCDFAEKAWPNDSPADVAHHEMGVLDIREEKYAAAVEELAVIRPGYPAAILSQAQLAMAAFAAARNKTQPAGADTRPYEQRAVEVASKLPELPKAADASTTFFYVRARWELGNYYLQARKYDQVSAVADPLLARFGDLDFPNGELREKSRSSLASLSLAARYGRASAEYEAGHYAEVSKALDPLVADAQAGKVPEFKTNAQLRWALLGLALRADVQQSKMDDAQKVLDLLQSLTAQNELEGGATATLVQLAQLLKSQVEEVRKKAPDQLPKTIESFSKFLDKLTAQQEKDGKALAPEVLLLLAQSYSSLDNHQRAAEMLQKVPEPKADAPQKDKDAWQLARVQHIRELRLDKQLDEAKKELAGILGTDKEPGWGQKNLEAQKEKLFLTMEDGKYMTAAKGFDGLTKALAQPQKFSTPGMKDQYFECYYYTVLCLYKHGTAPQTDEKKAAASIKQAANLILTLEGRWPDLGGEVSKARFDDLLAKEEPLKKQYDQLKGGK
jgi:hypothetical protein